VFRPPFRNTVLLFFSALTVASVCVAIFGPVGLVVKVVLAVLAIWSFTEATDIWRQGLYIQATGVRIVGPLLRRPLRIEWRPLIVEWNEIDRFEKRSEVGESPVTLIRAAGQEPVTVPTFPKPGRHIPDNFEQYQAQIQAQVDELNGFLHTHRRSVRLAERHATEGVSADSAGDSECKCRELFESAHDRASDFVALTNLPQIREAATRFLTEYERVSALSGSEFRRVALVAVERFDDETEAAAAKHLRDTFERVCTVSAQVLEEQDGFYSSIGERGQARELSATGERFRGQALVFLADAERIRALSGEKFTREAQAAFDAFTTMSEMDAMKAEIRSDWAATPLGRRLHVFLSGFRR